MADINASQGNNDRKLDEMLDGLLSEYSAAQPRPGLEMRILANLREQSAAAKDESTPRVWRWNFAWMRVGMMRVGIWAGAAMATAAILLAIYLSRPSQQTRAPQIVQHSPQQEAPRPVQQKNLAGQDGQAGNQLPDQRLEELVKKKTVKNTMVAERQVAVRQEVFPSPSPLSDQEKLLFRYLARTPREELVGQSHPDPPAELSDGNDSKESNPNNLTQVQQRNSNTR